MIQPSRTAQAACDLILTRDAIGLAKYGKSMDREDLKPREWLQHAIEESADGIQYMIRLGVRLDDIARAAYRQGVQAGLQHDRTQAREDAAVKELLG